MLNYKELLAELANIKLGVVLERDPLAKHSLDYFNEKLYDVQSARDRVLTMVMEALWNKTQINIELSSVKEEYSLELAKIFQREEVRALKSDKLREAVANGELVMLLKQIELKEREALLADAYHKNTVIVYEELKSLNENLINQFATVRAMLNLDPNLRDMVIDVSKQKLKE